MLAAAAQEDEGGQADDEHRGGGAGHEGVDLTGSLADLLHRPVDILLRAHPVGYGIDGARQLRERAGQIDPIMAGAATAAIVVSLTILLLLRHRKR